MERRSKHSQHYKNAAEMFRSGLRLILQGNTSSVLIWEPEYLSHLIQHLNILYHAPQQIKNTQKPKLENFIAKCCWYHKDTLKQSVNFFKNLSLMDEKSYNDNQKIQRLKTLNILIQIPWFPHYAINISSFPEGLNLQQKVYWTNILKAKGDQVQINEEEAVQQIKKLRQFLTSSNDERQQFVSRLKQQSQYFHISDLNIRIKSSLEKQILSQQLVVLITSEQQLPQEFEPLYPKIQVWVDKSIEFNSLIGNYICSEKFGQFKWVNGPLIYALQQGFWLVMNNFQEASNQLIVALKSIVSNGCLYSQSLGKVYASPGFRIVGISKQPVQNIPSILVQEKNFEVLLEGKKIHEKSREFLVQVFNENKKLGYSKLKKIWRRIEFVWRQFVESQCEFLVNDIWQGYYITERLKQLIKEEVDEINNRFIPKTVDYVNHGNKVKIGRVSFDIVPQAFMAQKEIVPTQYSLRIMEKISMGIAMNESILLVSETGCGKTTLIQHLAKLRGKKLYVINMNLGSQVSDLVGGFKPLDFKFVYQKLLKKFRKYFDMIKTQNSIQFQNRLLKQCSQPDNYQNVLKMIYRNLQKLKKRTQQSFQKDNTSVKKINWEKLQQKIKRFLQNYQVIKSQLVFSFVEGNLLKAIKSGDWVLVDEINLAGNEVLQKLVPLIIGKSILMYEKGDLKTVTRHPDFRIFGCMNPGNDHGKKQLPKNLVQKFTILQLPQPQKDDIKFFIQSKCSSLDANKLSDLYFQLRKTRVLSLRNLSRALNYINKNRSIYGQRAIYDGLVLGFGQKQPFEEYDSQNSKLPSIQGHVQRFGFLIAEGPLKATQDKTFKITTRFSEHLHDLLRAIAGTDLPVMLEGPTSAGKTRMVRYIATISGHKCIRINNHEHTDVEQYLGTYYPNKAGQLVFRQGPLLEAVRNGYWLILDELNLARSQILECLNRLLDDNRQLFLPEIQQTIKPHPHFRIFATQNPTSYSGRKTLSKAFRNRFVQLQMGQINTQETIQILRQRVPFVEQSKQTADYLKNILNKLSQYRLREKVFIKDAVITIRDLLKWTSRQILNDNNNLFKKNFAMEGFTVIGERLRTLQQKQFVKDVLCLNKDNEKEYYRDFVKNQFDSSDHIRLNDSFSRMAALTLKALRNKQPVLLIGETGCGKTTLAELLAKKFNRPFYSINCHKHIQASDFLGCLRPNSIRSEDQSPFVFVNGVLLNALINGGVLLIDQINTAQDSVLQRMNQVLQGGQTIGVERGQGWEVIQAHPEFRIIATMNPSGDFGKKQLSPALRNRFTQIWVQPVTHPAYLEYYKSISQSSNEQNDVLQMIIKEMGRKGLHNQSLAKQIFELVYQFNCKICQKYMLQKRTLTMRDIVWMVSYLFKSKHLNDDLYERFKQAQHILLIQGVQFLPLSTQSKNQLKNQLRQIIKLQNFNPLSTLLQLDFPVLVSTDLPLHLIPINFQKRIFFNIYTQLSDILGQYRPEGNVFKWHDGPLLSAVKRGGTVALIDLNLAQQQVIEGVNSLFDYRGNIFVVDLDTTFEKHPQFRPVVILKTKIEGDRKMLPNSFLNRFVKLHLGEFTIQNQIDYLQKQYPQVAQQIFGLLQQLLQAAQSQNLIIKLKQIEIFCEIYQNTFCLKRSLRIAFLSNLQSSLLIRLVNSIFSFQKLLYKPIREQQHLIFYLPLLHKNFQITEQNQIQLLLNMLVVYHSTSKSIILTGKQSKSKTIICEAFAWLLNQNFVHILLANNTDSAELLGSYEQMQVEGTPVFQYMPSRLVQSLNIKNLVYIEVFSDKMVERIEKGIEDIYDCRQRVIMGCDGANIQTVSVEFDFDQKVKLQNSVANININRTEQILEKYIQKKRVIPNITYFSSITKQLSRDQMMIIIQQLIDNLLTVSKKASFRKSTEDQNIVSKILKSLQDIYNGISLQLNPGFSMISIEVERRSSLLRYLQSSICKTNNSIIQYNELSEKLYRQLSISEHMPKNLDQFKLHCCVKYLFELDSLKSDQLLRLFTYDEQVTLKQVRKVFQRLYIANPSEFRKSAISMLKVIRTNKQLLLKFFEQVKLMSEGFYTEHLIMIQQALDNQIIKTIPILNSNKAVKHYIADLIQQQEPNYPVIPLFGLVNHQSDILPSYHSVLPNFQSKLLASIQSFNSSNRFQIIGHAVGNTSMKHTKLLDIFNESFLRMEKAVEFDIDETLRELTKRIQITTELDRREMGKVLLDLFSPKQSLQENISYFSKNYQKYEILTTYHDFDQIFYGVNKFMSKIRCGEYEPSVLGQINQNLENTSKQINQLGKYIVYRGSNNLDELKYFFQNLIDQFSKLRQQHFTRQSIIYFIRKTSEFYDRFKDILIPLITGLILLTPDEQVTQNVLIKFCNKPSIAAYIQDFTLQELPDKMEEDNAKRYMLLQRKLHQMVIDEYTKEGEQFHKDQQEQDFKQDFRQGLIRKQQDPLQQIFSYFRQNKMDYYHMALHEINRIQRIEELAVWMSILTKTRSKEDLNIYSEASIEHARPMIDELNTILSNIKHLMRTFKTQQTNSLCILVNAILDLKVFKTQIYKLLEGCEHIVDKLFQLNNTLPKSLHIPTQNICNKIIELRKIEMRNWAKMITLKQQRIQRNDLVEFIQLWRLLYNEKPTDQEIFILSDRFIRDSTIGTFKLRMDNMQCLGSNLQNWTNLMRVHEFYKYFQQQHSITVKDLKETIDQEIKQYKQLAGWKSTNYLILKSTSQKFQRSIHKILKKYEDSLKAPFSSIIQKYRQKGFATSLQEYHSKFVAEAQQNSNNSYQQIICSIFSSIQDMRSESHNNKSRMTVLNQYAKQLDFIIKDLLKQIPVLHTDMNFVPTFSDLECSSKLKKYYYGIWDKFNQRNEIQGKWEVETIDRLWRIVENGWKYINHWIYTKNLTLNKVEDKVTQFTKVEKLLKPYGWTVHNKKELKGHPIFEKQVVELNRLIKSRQQTQPINLSIEVAQVEEMSSFMKLLYVSSNIILNLQKSGFCVKQQEQQQQGQGEITKQGMGLGEADADKEAENIGDEIQFEEQLQGLKGDKEANQQDMDNKEDKKDFQMENDFNGQAQDLQPKENQQQQEQNDENIDQGFGEVGKQDQNQVDQGQDSDKEDNGQNNKEQDLQFKTDKKGGQDDQIKAKDEPKDKKDQRNLGQDEFKENSEGEEDSNMQPGEKLDEMQIEEEDENQNLEKNSDVQEVDSKGMDIEEQDERQLDIEEKDDQERGDENQEMQDTFEHKNEDKDMMQDQMEEQNQQVQQQKQKKPQLKSKSKPKKNPAYGVEGQDKNPLLNGQNQNNNEEQQNDNQGENAQGKQQQQKTQQNNTFSKELMEEVIKAAQQTGNQEFKRNLNVVQKKLQQMGVDENKEENDEDQLEGEQFGVSQDSKLKTNLTSKQRPEKVQPIVQDQEQQQMNEEMPQQKKQRVPTQKKQTIEDQKKNTQKQSTNKNKVQQQLISDTKQQKSTKKQVKHDVQSEMKIEASLSNPLNRKELSLQQCNQIMISSNPQGMELESFSADNHLITQSQKHSYQLYEQLKAVLEPQQIASYQGDYKTGKKLNMRKIIPFIASQYRKDRIWLRRSEPTDRNYQILIGIDDTKSMGINDVGRKALEGSFALAFALSKLNIKINISRMRDRMTVLHGFQQLFTESVGRQIVSKFSFGYQDMNSHNLVMPNFMKDSLAEFKSQKDKSSNQQTQQLCFIVSDGRFNKNYVRPFLRQAAERGIIYIFIIVDKVQNSILNIKEPVAQRNANGTFTFDVKKKYMNDFPFDYYLIVKDIKQLSGILVEVLRQYFQQK